MNIQTEGCRSNYISFLKVFPCRLVLNGSGQFSAWSIDYRSGAVTLISPLWSCVCSWYCPAQEVLLQVCWLALGPELYPVGRGEQSLFEAPEAIVDCVDNIAIWELDIFNSPLLVDGCVQGCYPPRRRSFACHLMIFGVGDLLTLSGGAEVKGSWVEYVRESS